MTHVPKPNWPDIIALFDDMERSCNSEQPKPEQPLDCWRRERLVMMLTAVFTHEAACLGASNGDHKSETIHEIHRIIHGALAGLVINFATSFKLSRDGKIFESDHAACVRVAHLLGREIDARLRALATDDTSTVQFIDTPVGARPSVEPFDFRKHMSDAAK